MPKTTYALRIRSYPDPAFVSVWLVRRDGAGIAGLLWGELRTQTAAALAEALGLPVEREGSPLAAVPMTPPGCATVAEQGELFGE